jgi:hypothetical protein
MMLKGVNLWQSSLPDPNCSCIVQTAIDNNDAMMKHLIISLPLAGLISAAGVFNAGAALAADCSSVGQQVADSQGGTLARATSVVQNGKEVCVVVVLIPGKDGERPRRVEVAVPAN